MTAGEQPPSLAAKPGALPIWPTPRGPRQAPLSVALAPPAHLPRPSLPAGEDVGAWSVDQVAGWLEGLQLGAVAPAFKTNAVDGGDLLALSDSDLREELGCTALQARKIRGALAKLTGQPAPAASPPSSSSAASLGSQPAVAASHQSSAPPVAVGVPVFAPAAAAAAAAAAGPAIPAADLERYRQLSSTIEGLEKLKVIVG